MTDQNNSNLANTFTLPTKGLLYEEGAKRFPNGEITVSSMTTREEKVITGGGGRSSAKLDTIIERCCDLKGMSATDMTSEDRAFLLVMIRVMSYGPKYRYEVKCPTCGRKSMHNVDLGGEELQVKYIDDIMDADQLVEPFEFTLPVSKKKVGWRFLRGSDESAIDRAGEQIARAEVEIGDPRYVYRIARHIVEIDGEKKQAREIMGWVEKMLAKDSMAFRHEVDRLSPGIEFMVDVECPFADCGDTSRLAMPMQVEFFRPSA